MDKETCLSPYLAMMRITHKVASVPPIAPHNIHNIEGIEQVTGFVAIPQIASHHCLLVVVQAF